jgi:hypothetical protein
MTAPVRRKNAQPERAIHLAVLAYLRLTLPGAVIHHSPQELGLSGPEVARAIAKAKHMGMVVGFPDIVCFWRREVWAFEVKAEGGRLSEAQSAVGKMLEANGARWAVVRSVADAEEAVREWRGALAGAGEWPWHPPHSAAVAREERP